MSGRTFLIIFIIGFIGLLSMGFMVKFAMEANPVLVEVGKFKQAFLKDHGERGAQEISVRALPNGAGYHLRATFTQIAGADFATLADELALYFVKEFSGQTRREVKVTLIETAGWGCRGDEIIFERDFNAADLKQKIFLEKTLLALKGAGSPDPRWRFAASTALGPEALKLEVALSSGPEPEEEDWDGLIDGMTRWVWDSLRDVAVRKVHLVVRSSLSSEKILKEKRLERVLRPAIKTRAPAGGGPKRPQPPSSSPNPGSPSGSTTGSPPVSNGPKR